MISEFEAECQKIAADQGLSLPDQFSAQKLFNVIRQVEFNKPVLDAAAILRHHGMLLLHWDVKYEVLKYAFYFFLQFFFIYLLKW